MKRLVVLWMAVLLICPACGKRRDVTQTEGAAAPGVDSPTQTASVGVSSAHVEPVDIDLTTLSSTMICSLYERQ